MDSQNSTGNAFIDGCFKIIECLVSIALLMVAEYHSEIMIICNIHWEHWIIFVSRLIAWWLGIAATTLTILNLLGYTPKWLRKIKNKLKGISHE